MRETDLRKRTCPVPAQWVAQASGEKGKGRKTQYEKRWYETTRTSTGGVSVAVKLDNALIQYTNLIMDLHEFMAAGKSDDDEADEIREQLMDMQIKKKVPSYADDLSGDLYMLVNEDMYCVLPEGNTKKEYRLRLDNAVNRAAEKFLSYAKKLQKEV